MKVTILHIGEVPKPLRSEFGAYLPMFHKMFASIDAGLEFESAPILDGAPFPTLTDVEAVLIPGAATGVYDDTPWMQPLRDFIRAAYAARVPLIGVCFGHQIMADALGGEVRKSEKGWGLGRHSYRVTGGHGAESFFGNTASIAASHQDQVITPPPTAKTFMASDFTPHAGLAYDNGAAVSIQPHPEFETAYAKALCDLRLSESFDQEKVDAAKATLDAPVDNDAAARFFMDFLKTAN